MAARLKRPSPHRHSAAPLFLGIDGGATRSLGVAVTAEGRVVAAAQAGSLNFLGTDLATARRSLRGLLGSLRTALPPGATFDRAVVGCAALFTDATHAEQKALCGGLLPLATTRVVSDCQTALFGATRGQPGVVIVAGTGSIVLAQAERGTLAQTGGWGHLLGDEGSAWWIARESIRAAIAAHEQRGPNTGLGQLICRFFRTSTLHAVASRVHGALGKDEIAALAAFLAQKTAPSDRVFRAILRRAGEELAAQALAAIRAADLRIRPIPLFLAGSVLTHNRHVRGSLLRALRAQFPLSASSPSLDPVLGAAALCLASAGIPLSPRVITTLRQTHAPFTAPDGFLSHVRQEAVA